MRSQLNNPLTLPTKNPENLPMKILLPVALAVCTIFTGCLPPPGRSVVVARGYHRDPYYPHVYPGTRTVVVRQPYRRPGGIVVVSRTAPAPRYEVAGRPPFPGARWITGRWSWEHGTWVWHRGHWVHRY